MKKILLMAMLLGSAPAFAQKCSSDVVIKTMSEKDPQVIERMNAIREARLEEYKQYRTQGNNSSLKTTATTTIPVIFHLVLTDQDMSDLGGTAGIEERINSQIKVMNEDFSAKNTDLSKVPAAFQSLIGDARIEFALAKRKPDGTSSKGYQIKKTTTEGLEFMGMQGSRASWSDMKYDGTDGLAQWDPKQYLNIWVGNLFFAGVPTSIMGVCTPVELMAQGVPEEELGVVIQYFVLGKKTKASQFFYPDIDGGRTLVHEVGHYFGLYHIWGNGSSCSIDDGFADTPEQFESSYDCPTFPSFDNCTATGNGLMFMNHMDYANDACNLMFSKDQVSFMQSEMQPGKYLYDLGQHPELTQWPTGIPNTKQGLQLSINPNPTTGLVTVNLVESATGGHVEVIDMMGSREASYNLQADEYTRTIDLTGLAKGMYFIICRVGKKVIQQKLIIQ